MRSNSHKLPQIGRLYGTCRIFVVVKNALGLIETWKQISAQSYQKQQRRKQQF